MTNYTVNILDTNYNSFEFINKNEKLLLTLKDINNFNVKFFNNDIISYDKENKNVLKIIKTDINNKIMVGKLKISNKMIYGLNNRKNPYYICDPIDKAYPSFLVAINDKKLITSNKSHYILFKFNNWKCKLPYGNLYKVIGEVGKENIEYQKILFHYNISQKKLKLDKQYKIQQNTNIFDIVNQKDLQDYEDRRDKYTIAIDPKGCLDIDDALGYEFKNNTHIISVYISDVSFWIDKLNLYKFIEKKYFTTYCPHKKFNVFPDILSDNLFSLKYNKDRLALCLNIYLNEDYDIINYEIKKSIIKLNKTMTYEKANNLIKVKNKFLCELFDISKKITKEDSQNCYDSHNMIETYMLLANNLIAKFLIEHNKQPILRIHDSPKFKINLSTCNIKNQETLNFLQYYQMNAAKYQIYKKDHDFDYYHYGLNLKYYCHFTSPIRRVIDIVTHLQIKEILENGKNKTLQNININIDKINCEQQKYKKMSRELEVINIINNKLIKTEYEAYIIDIKYNLLSIYIPDLKYLYTKEIYNKNLLSLVEQTLQDDMLMIKHKQNNKNINFKKFQKLNIKLIKNINKLNLVLDLSNIFI